VICGEAQVDSQSPTHVVNPSAVIEVLSPSTEDYDRNEKWEHYQRLESLRAYVLVAQDRRLVEVWVRDGEQWSSTTHGPGDTIELAAVRCTLQVDALYDEAGVAL
jgi:Uma2 family endonuclease